MIEAIVAVRRHNMKPGMDIFSRSLKLLLPDYPFLLSIVELPL
jgi:hypothetical protein